MGQFIYSLHTARPGRVVSVFAKTAAAATGVADVFVVHCVVIIAIAALRSRHMAIGHHLVEDLLQSCCRCGAPVTVSVPLESDEREKKKNAYWCC